MEGNRRTDTLCVKCDATQEADFGVALFGKLYQQASAYAIVTSEEQREMRIFDTAFARETLYREWPEGARVVLYTNHPEGNMLPSEDDMENLAAMPAGTELYVVWEDRCVRWEPKPPEMPRG